MSFKPEPNKAIERERELRAYESHRKRVDNAQPTVDTRPPRTYMHQHLNMKRLQLEEERLAEIERENRKLLQRMSDIMRTGGRIDNWNQYEHRSNGGGDKRRTESLRIAKENQYIHDRIVSRKPEYDQKQWKKAWEVNQKRIEQHSTFNKDGSEKYPRRPEREEKVRNAQSSQRNKKSGGGGGGGGGGKKKEKKETERKEESSHDTHTSNGTAEDSQDTNSDINDERKRDDEATNQREEDVHVTTGSRAESDDSYTSP